MFKSSSASFTFLARAETVVESFFIRITFAGWENFVQTKVLSTLNLSFPSITTSHLRLDEMSSISINASSGTISGRLVISSEFTDTMQKTLEFWYIAGPPADMEYADEPIGVDTIRPSLLSCHNSSPFTLNTCSTNVALFEENIATSFSAG